MIAHLPEPAGLERTATSARFAALRLRLLRVPQRHPRSWAPEALELVCRAAVEALGVEPYQVQQQAALVMACGGVAEMATGEGKTLSVALAATTLAASAQRVHIATANDYLAARDYELFRSLYRHLGITVGLCQTQQSASQRASAYANDVVYGTANHFAFDHLRTVLQRQNGLRSRLGQRVLRSTDPPFGTEPPFAASVQKRDAIIVDEIDHVLIDEADTPLVLSVPNQRGEAVPSSVYADARTVADRLTAERDWLVDRQAGRVTLTDLGRATVLRHQPAAPLARPWFEYVQRAIEADVVLTRDIDYVIRRDKVELIDRATGRISEGRQWQGGLYQAVEHRENLQPTPENAAAVQITRWRFFQMYRHVSGCSGTAWDCRQELRSLYGLETTVIPLRCPSELQIAKPHFSASKQQKFTAVLDEVSQIHDLGRPVLVGTRTIQDSHAISEELQHRRLPHRLLNGSQSEEEANIIAQAGRSGAVTVATDLAGRGTDIKLSSETAALGGLHVILAEPRHSPRLDRQLIGRAGRQGQPGSARVFVSAEDELIARHAPGLSRVLAKNKQDRQGSDVLWRAVVRAGRRSEAQRAAVRRLIAQRDRQHDQYFSAIDLSNH